MTFYSIKYIDTKGIEPFQGETIDGHYAKSTEAQRTNTPYGRFEKIGQDCFPNLQEAQRAAKDKLARKLLSIDKKRQKIYKLWASLS